MRKYIVLPALILLFSCAKEEEAPVQSFQEENTYILTVEAKKGERSTTKALMYDELADKLEASWAIGEEVKVYKGEALLGTLTAQSAGASTTLKGTVTGVISEGNTLVLKFLSAEYDSQDGTLTGRPTSIDKTCDHAIAEVTVQSVTESGITTSDALFVNQQAIVLFYLRNEDNSGMVKALNLLITAGGRTITINPTIALPRFYVAIPALSSSPVLMRARAGNKVYMLYKESVTLEAGKFYVVTARLSEATVVHDESELSAAVQTNNVKILFANDISINSLVEITGNRTVTINMAGYKLDRGLTARGTAGQVFAVRDGATLNLSNGTLTGGWGGDSGGIDNYGTSNLTDVSITGCTGDDRGGAIANRGTLTMTRGTLSGNTSNDHTTPEGGGAVFNFKGATATLTNVSITGNRAVVKGGGGICNYGTMTLDGCIITDNSCQLNGGGIWTAADATLNMKGEMTVADNTAAGRVTNNLFLKTGAVITVTGSLTDSSIGVNMESITGTFTSGYSTYNSGEDPSTLFFSDLAMTVNVTSTGTEAQMAYAMDVSYIERSWDDVNKQIISETKTLKEGDYTALTSGGDISLNSGYYVVRGKVSRGTIDLTGGHTVHLILCDGAKLTANFIHMEDGDEQGKDELYIYSQSYGGKMGRLRVEDSDGDYNAGIGTDYTEKKSEPSAGTLIIHGGDIYVKGGTNAAAIGGGRGGKGGNVYVYGGKVEAHGDDGSGANSGGGAGIGGGNLAPAGSTWVYGGEVYAYGGQDAAGIGSGDGGNVMAHSDQDFIHGGWFTMYGGYVETHGGGNGAGIGAGEYSPGPKEVNIYGGVVKAYGGEDAAGIGGGYMTIDYGDPSGVVNIYGGEVYAYGKDEGAGIGGGENSPGADVTITGGIVEAHAGENELYYKAIGPGRDSDEYGKLDIGKNLMVRYKISGKWSDPVRADYQYGLKAGAWYHTEARIEPCTHPGYTASSCPYHYNN